ncbi:MAG: hypothetical protein FRX49_12973 [Trebouxia sp. A1-2]|nr:MAG: hypothetical protein FRX49_12973 [Trebouxia sp. A1-2]
MGANQPEPSSMGLSPKWITYLPASVKSSLPNPWKLRSIKAMGPVDTVFGVVDEKRVTVFAETCPRLLISLAGPSQQAKCFHFSSYRTETTEVKAFGLLLKVVVTLPQMPPLLDRSNGVAFPVLHKDGTVDEVEGPADLENDLTTCDRVNCISHWSASATMLLPCDAFGSSSALF